MLYRHHTDPLYYDPNANQRIFVPVGEYAGMTESQRKIIDSMPEDMTGNAEN